MSKNIRIRTEPNGDNVNIKVQLSQDFDFLEILSLKISQEDVYRNFYSDYGVVVGRVSINSGVGIPNANVSIFIPLTDDDAEDLEISSLYPYSDLSIVNSDGIRYNLLPKDSQDECHTPVGTISNKRDLLDNDKLLEVYEKYYKYTTTTNDSGDFMIFGVPVGNHILNVDVDLSDIGIYSQRPYDFIEGGNPTKLFESPTKFKGGINLNSLTQLKNRQIGVNVIPFWGENLGSEVGITRVDVDLNYNLVPKAIFVGSIFGDNEINSVNKNCRPRKKLGKVCEMSEGGGTIEMLRKTQFGENERFDIEGGQLINDNGAWAYQIPMNLDYMISDEYGNLIPTEDITRGIPTRARLRFKIDTDVDGGEGRLRTRAKYLVPHNPTSQNEVNYNFDDTTPDIHFRDFHWNKIYTVKNFIGRFQPNNNVNNRNFIGFKDVDNCVGTKNPIPFNHMDKDFNPLFLILCLILTIIIGVITVVNSIISFGLKIGPFNLRICKLGIKCFNFKCGDGEKKFTPGCNSSCPGAEDNVIKHAQDCVEITLADALNVIEFDFYNDWLNGSLYSFLLKYKKKKKVEKFCGDDTHNGTNYLVNTNKTNEVSVDGQDVAIRDGVVVSKNGELFYKPISTQNNVMYATDIYNLGSVFDCDWQGISKVHNELTSTSYQLPEFTSDGTEPTLEPLLLEITCLAVTTNSSQTLNIRRISEIGVEFTEVANKLINNKDVNNVLLRNKLIKLNDSNLINANIGDIDSTFDGNGYISYRNLSTKNSLEQPFGNSFYFYFGTKPNNTSLDLMNSKYFSTCTRLIKNNIIINGDVINVTFIDGNDGIITIDVIGGSGNYSYQWFTSNNVVFSTMKDISGLSEGAYYVIVTDDENGMSNKRVFSINGLKAIQTTIKTQDVRVSNDGKIEISSITGGDGPYDIEILTPSGSILSYDNILYTLTIPNLGLGTYSITISDDKGVVSPITISVELTYPTSLGITTPIVISPSCYMTNDGEINFTVIGGTSPYDIKLTGPSGETYRDVNNSGLSGGTYNLVVDDYYGQTLSQNIIVPIIPNLVLSYSILTTQFTLNGTIDGVTYNLYHDESLIQSMVASGISIIFNGNGIGSYEVLIINSPCSGSNIVIV